MAAYPEASVYGEYIEIPASFPCICLVESDNYTYRETQDMDLLEHHANVTYELNVYSNKSNGKKSEAKAIMNLVDNEMQKMKFTRTMRNQIPNADRSIFRIVARYSAVVSKGKQIDTDTIYQMYRR